MKRTVQAVFVCLAAIALPASVHAQNLVEGDKSVSGSVQFERPARVCALSQVDPTLIALVEGRSETELQSIAKTPSNLSSEIEETVKSEMSNGGDAALYDAAMPRCTTRRESQFYKPSIQKMVLSVYA